MSWIAERMQRESRKRRICGWMPQPKSGPSASEGQALLRSKELTLLLDSRRGGRLLELSDRRAQRNLVETGWVDHLFEPESRLSDFARGRLRELSDLPLGPCSVRVEEKSGFVRAVLSRQAELGRGKTVQALQVRKTVTLPARGRRVLFTHRLLNGSGRPAEFLFASELTLNLKDAHVNHLGEAPGLLRFSVLDPAARLEIFLRFSRPARLWYFPLETGSGRQRTYQGVKLAGVWPVKLAPRRSWQLRWELQVEEPRGWRRN